MIKIAQNLNVQTNGVRKNPEPSCVPIRDTPNFLPEESNTPIKTSKRMTPKNKNRTGSDHISAEGVEN